MVASAGSTAIGRDLRLIHATQQNYQSVYDGGPEALLPQEDDS
jgi:hypothetical protein